MCHKSPWGRGREKRRPSALAGGHRDALQISIGIIQFNATLHFGRFRRFVGTDSPEFIGSIRTRSELHILENGVAGAFQIGVRLAGNSLI
jgi:hypothetical protein